MPIKAFITDIQYDKEKEVWQFIYRDMVLLEIKSDVFYFCG